MKSFFTSIRFKLILGSILFFCVFSLGAYARPGIDKTAVLMTSMFERDAKTYVSAPVVLSPEEIERKEYEDAVTKKWQSSEHQSVCKNAAREIIALEFAQKYAKKSSTYASESKKFGLMTEYKLSDSLVAELNRIEQEQGRGQR